MALISKPYTFTTGATIYAAEHNSNFDTIYNLVNGNIDNANIKASAGIIDSKLDTISTAGKVDIGALGKSGQAQGQIIFRDSTAWTTLSPSTSGYVLTTQGTSADVLWADVNTLSGVLWEESGGNTQLKTADDIDFQQKQGIQFVLENRTSDPGSPVTGEIWFRTDV